MADDSLRPGSAGISSNAAPTDDIDDDWALDDDDDESVPQASSTPVAQSKDAAPKQASASDGSSPAAAAASNEPAASPGGLAATEVVDSAWPGDDENAAPTAAQLKRPKIPTAANVPAEARAARSESEHDSVPSTPIVSVGNAQAAATPPRATSDPGEETQESEDTGGRASRPRFSEPSVQRFEAAASAIAGERGPYGGLASDRPSEPAADSPTGESLAPSQSKSQPPRQSAKKRGPWVGLGLAAAAVLAVGIGLATRGGPSELAGVERSENPLHPDPKHADSKVNADPTPAPGAAPGKKQNDEPSDESPTNGDAQAADDQAADDQAADDQGESEKSDTSEEPADAKDSDSDTVKVKVNIYPPGAEIYRKGRRVGRGGDEIEIPKGERWLFVVVLDGYVPRKLILDGTESVVNLGLRKASPPTFLPKESESDASTGTKASKGSLPAAPKSNGTAAAGKHSPAPAKTPGSTQSAAPVPHR